MPNKKKVITREELILYFNGKSEEEISLAIMYAENYMKYGTDITEKWKTATQQTELLHNAEKYGYCKALEGENLVRCKGCAYDKTRCSIDFNTDILSLLKEQEPMKPIYQERSEEYVCPKCGRIVWKDDCYCSKCGQRLNGNEKDHLPRMRRG